MTENRQQVANEIGKRVGVLLLDPHCSEALFQTTLDAIIRAIEDYKRRASYRTIVDLHEEDEDDEL